MDKLVGATNAELEAIYDEKLNKLPTSSPIYLPTTKLSLIDRIRGVEHVAKIYRKDLDKVYRPRLRALREQYKSHKRCFLIGNGPSLNKTDLSVLKDEVTFAVNGFFLKAADLDWKPTFYLIEDHLVAEDRAPWVNEFYGPIKLFPAYLGYMFPASDDTIFYNHRPRKSYPHGFDFSMEADKITYTGCTVTFSMMQIAAYLGFEEIYLIGVDASYDIPKDSNEGKDYGVGILDMKSDDPNHFDPDYFGKGFRWHDPQVEKMVEAYEEARRTLEGTGQTIYNATVGGQLEVFERRSFHEIFPEAKSPAETEAENEARREAKFPRLLILDMTPMGDGTATGEVKASLLGNWTDDRLLQVARKGRDELVLITPRETGEFGQSVASAAEAAAAVDAFDPDVILYRPVPDVPWLHDFAMQTIRRLDRPLVSWMMDDWPAQIARTDPEQWARLEPDLREVLGRSERCLSICDAMSAAFGERYGKRFDAFANGVNTVDWDGLRQHEGTSLLIRYAGGLARNMTQDSVLRIARAVETLAERDGLDIRLEITTQPWWYRDSKDLFEGFRHTRIETATRSKEEYRSWVSGADVALIAYNFDDETLRYVRYSMANKMPECLASGAVVLAHGPMDVATIRYLDSTDAAVIVSRPEEEAIIAALRELAASPALRNTMAGKARDIAFARHNLTTLRTELREILSAAAKMRQEVDPAPMAPDNEHDLLLSFAAARIMLDPVGSSRHLTNDPALASRIESAVEAGGPKAEHFLRVRAWAESRGFKKAS